MEMRNSVCMQDVSLKLNMEHYITSLVFTSLGSMADECKTYHSRLAELIANKKGEEYATTIAWIRAKVSFSILRSALLCLRGSRTVRRPNLNMKDIDFDIETSVAAINQLF